MCNQGFDNFDNFDNLFILIFIFICLIYNLLNEDFSRILWYANSSWYHMSFSGGGEQSKYICVANKDKTKTCM